MTDVLAELLAEVAEPDFMNPVHARTHALTKDSPGKVWWDAEAMHPAIFRALKLDRQEEGAVFAAMPFRLQRMGTGARILVALPCPRFFAPGDDDWLSIESVLAWNPVNDTVEVVGDPAPTLVGNLAPDAVTTMIYGSAFAFFRATAEARAQWLTAYLSIGGDWKRKPVEPDLTPGFLLIGKPDAVRWPTHRFTENLVCVDVDARAVNTAMLRQARIPRAIAAPQALRRAA